MYTWETLDVFKLRLCVLAIHLCIRTYPERKTWKHNKWLDIKDELFYTMRTIGHIISVYIYKHTKQVYMINVVGTDALTMLTSYSRCRCV